MQFPRPDYQWGNCPVMTLFTFTETSGYRHYPQYINLQILQDGMAQLTMRGIESITAGQPSGPVIMPPAALLEHLSAMTKALEQYLGVQP